MPYSVKTSATRPSTYHHFDIDDIASPRLHVDLTGISVGRSRTFCVPVLLHFASRCPSTSRCSSTASSLAARTRVYNVKHFTCRQRNGLDWRCMTAACAQPAKVNQPWAWWRYDILTRPDHLREPRGGGGRVAQCNAVAASALRRPMSDVIRRREARSEQGPHKHGK